MNDNETGTRVPFLADTSAEDNQGVISAAASLLNAAKEDRLVTVMCTHNETGDAMPMLCIMTVDEGGSVASYTPIGRLYGGHNLEWADYTPPNVAIQLPEEDDDNGSEDGIREAS